MAAQLTLQAPLEIPPDEVSPYLERLWTGDLETSTGAATFTLLVWEPSWLEQQLVRIGRVDGPIRGLDRDDLIEAARELTASCGLPPSLAPMDPRLIWQLGQLPGLPLVHPLKDRRAPAGSRGASCFSVTSQELVSGGCCEACRQAPRQVDRRHWLRP